MNNRIIRHAAIRALVSATLFVVQNSAFTQGEPRLQEPTQIAQFCAPSNHDIDAPRVYCRTGADKRSSDGKMRARLWALFDLR